MVVVSVVEFADFKRQNSLDKVEVIESASGKHFIRVAGERIGVSEGTDLSKPLIVLEMENNGESWRFICEQKPQKVVAII